MTKPDYRAMCAELLAAIQLYTKLNPAASDMSPFELTEKLMDALARWGNSQGILDSSPQPVAVSERLPEPSVKVLAHYFNDFGKGRTICAIWVPAKSRSDEGDLDSNDFLEYDEDGDKYYWPEGWYEAIENWEELGWAKVYEGEVAYWQPLPKWPANALPTPEATNV